VWGNSSKLRHGKSLAARTWSTRAPRAILPSSAQPHEADALSHPTGLDAVNLIYRIFRFRRASRPDGRTQVERTQPVHVNRH